MPRTIRAVPSHLVLRYDGDNVNCIFSAAAICGRDIDISSYNEVLDTGVLVWIYDSCEEACAAAELLLSNVEGKVLVYVDDEEFDWEEPWYI